MIWHLEPSTIWLLPPFSALFLIIGSALAETKKSSEAGQQLSGNIDKSLPVLPME
jgi:hypothetical protein